MAWNNKELFVSRGGNFSNKNLLKALEEDLEGCYGIAPSDLDNCIQQPTEKQELEYLQSVLDLDLRNDYNE